MVALFCLLLLFLIALAIAVESGRATRHMRLVSAGLILGLASSTAMVFSHDDSTRFGVKVPVAAAARGPQRLPLDYFVPPPRPAESTVKVEEGAILEKVDCENCPTLVRVGHGGFMMGSPETEIGREATEGPMKRVDISTLLIGKTEVTRDEFADFVRETSYRPQRGCLTRGGYDPLATWDKPGIAQEGNHPVVCVDFADAMAYVTWLARKTGKPYRLLSEAEWEYAARAGERHARPNDRSQRITDFRGTQVGTEGRANNFGLFGMMGNASEYVADCWTTNLADLPDDGSPLNLAGPLCERGVVRGSNWRSNLAEARFAKRGLAPPSDSIGFRVARTLSLADAEEMLEESLSTVQGTQPASR